MKYQKKPLVIEAIIYNGTNHSAIREFMKADSIQFLRAVGSTDDSVAIIIPTLEGNHAASVGDYIIKGIKGEFYPCKPDIFEASYDKID